LPLSSRHFRGSRVSSESVAAHLPCKSDRRVKPHRTPISYVPGRAKQMPSGWFAQTSLNLPKGWGKGALSRFLSAFVLLVPQAYALLLSYGRLSDGVDHKYTARVKVPVAFRCRSSSSSREYVLSPVVVIRGSSLHCNCRALINRGPRGSSSHLRITRGCKMLLQRVRLV